MCERAGTLRSPGFLFALIHRLAWKEHSLNLNFRLRSSRKVRMVLTPYEPSLAASFSTKPHALHEPIDLLVLGCGRSYPPSKPITPERIRLARWQSFLLREWAT
jgi:hypothetical protein